MRFRFTIILLVANIALFLAIWRLESGGGGSNVSAASGIDISKLVIEGKNIASPRVVERKNNKWKITSPLDWPANSFSVNRIRNQLEFLDKETSFPVSEISRYGNTLSDYGLDSPSFTIKYGNGKTMRTLKIGSNAPVGGRIYMLDEDGGRIFVVDRQFADNFAVDMDHLRDQSVFSVSNFEITAFSVMIPRESGSREGIKRLGLRKDGGVWKMETPVVAAADQREVDNFLNNLCSIQAKSFSVPASARTGFEKSALSASITLEGTNRRDELKLGNFTDDGSRIYAKLEGNPTVFTLDSSMFKNLGSLQTALRDKAFAGVDPDTTTGLDISVDGRTIKLRKLRGELGVGGIWDVVEALPDGKIATAMADMGVVQDLLRRFQNVRARDFVSSAPTPEELKKFGLTGKDTVRITDIQSDKNSRTLAIGDQYAYGGATLRYAMIEGEPHVYGISEELPSALSSDFLHYRSKRLEMFSEKIKVLSVKISDAETGETIFEASSDSGNWNSEYEKLPARKAAALKELVAGLKAFNVKDYVRQSFSKDGVKISDVENEKWRYKLSAVFGETGKGKSPVEERTLYFSKRLGGGMQYGGSERAGATFVPTRSFINAFSELTIEIKAPSETNHRSPEPPSLEVPQKAPEK